MKVKGQRSSNYTNFFVWSLFSFEVSFGFSMFIGKVTHNGEDKFIYSSFGVINVLIPDGPLGF